MKTMLLLCVAVCAAVGLPAVAADPPASAATAAAPVSTAPTVTQEELLAKLAAHDPGLVVLDVRTPAEFAAGHVPGARNIPHDELPQRLAELDALRDTPVVLYCRSGRRAAVAEQTLRGAGFRQLRHLQGDWQEWEAKQQPVERTPAARP